MASRLDALTAQVAELTALVNILATQGASVTVTETKPAKKSRKKKAKATPAWNYYAIGKENRDNLRWKLKHLLRETCETEDDFSGWTWKDLTACADDQGVNYSHLIG